MRDRLRELLARSLAEAHRTGRLKTASARIEVEKPRQEGHGDLATNLAMVLASKEKRPPREVARILIEALSKDNGFISEVEIAGPGFINFTLADQVWLEVADQVLAEGETYGRTDLGQGRKVQVEFVSANPTGPLHVGHGRGAALGDALANILAAAGYRVEREYYINDAGRQMLILGGSVFHRYLQLQGREEPEPPEIYKGDYIKDLAAAAADKFGPDLVDENPDQAARRLYPEAAETIMAGIKADLSGFGIEYDHWFSERSLHDSGRMAASMEELKNKGVAYRAEGALWYRTEESGDEKDRVLIKSNGDLTYFAADVAYHADKFNRGFDWVIDVWGADHHGYVPRMTAAVKGLSQGKMKLTCKLVQLVNLLRGGVPVSMSTRAGEFVTLREVLEEVGRDACRFIFLTRRSESQLDFDLELAKSQSMDNPVYYVQYAHARVASIKRKAIRAGLSLPGPGGYRPTRLVEPEEMNLLKIMAAYPDQVAGAAEALEPHRLTYYLTDLAAAFHNYYNHHRVLVDDQELSLARLGLVGAVQQVVKNGLTLLGVSAPERMIREPENEE